MTLATPSIAPTIPSGQTSGLAGPAVELRHVHKRWGNFVALDDINLAVNPGQLVTILGPSGCGKTTLLRIIGGLESLSGGHLFMNGRDVSRLPVSQRHCGILFQSYALFPSLTVEQNVGYGLKAMTRAQRAQRISQMLELVGLWEMAKRYPAQLSGGQQQRVALARALAISPATLLLDEPLSALDAQVRVRLRQEICGIQRQLHLPTIMVTHDQEEALTMADLVIVMDHGRIAQIGTPRQLYEQPATAFVAAFLGSMNFIAGWQVDEAGVLRRGRLRVARPDQAAELPQGKTWQLAFRPEDALVVGMAHGAADAKVPLNHFPVWVQRVEFRGAVLRIYASMRDGTPDAPTLLVDLRAGAASNINVAENMTLLLHVPPECIQIFPASVDAP